MGTCPPLPAQLVNAAKWSIAHQGASVWTGSNGNVLLSGEPLRAALLDKQTNPKTGQFYSSDGPYIRDAKIVDLESATAQAVAECVGEQVADVTTGMEYTCRGDDGHAGAQPTILSLRDHSGWTVIRETFHQMESHRDFANRLSCYNGTQLTELIRDHCPAPKPRPPVQRRSDH